MDENTPLLKKMFEEAEEIEGVSKDKIQYVNEILGKFLNSIQAKNSYVSYTRMRKEFYYEFLEEVKGIGVDVDGLDDPKQRHYQRGHIQTRSCI